MGRGVRSRAVSSALLPANVPVRVRTIALGFSSSEYVIHVVSPRSAVSRRPTSARLAAPTPADARPRTLKPLLPALDQRHQARQRARQHQPPAH